MSEPSWVGLGGLVASSLSAVAAYLAIRQTLIQRRIANKVQIITKNVKVTLEKRKIGIPISFDNKSDEFKCKLPILNVGLGPALKFKYKWIFDYEKHLRLNDILRLDKDFENDTRKYLSAIHSKDYTYQYDNDNRILIHILGNGTTNWFSQNEMYSNIDYILPWGTQKEEVNLGVPSLILILLSKYSLEKSELIFDIFHHIQGPLLVIEYEDITGKKYKEIFESSFKTVRTKMQNNFYEAEFSLSFSHSKSWTSMALQKIRKRYADWKYSIL